MSRLKTYLTRAEQWRRTAALLFNCRIGAHIPLWEDDTRTHEVSIGRFTRSRRRWLAGDFVLVAGHKPSYGDDVFTCFSITSKGCHIKGLYLRCVEFLDPFDFSRVCWRHLEGHVEVIVQRLPAELVDKTTVDPAIATYVSAIRA